MNIKEAFLSSLISPPRIASNRESLDFLGKIYTPESDDSSPFLQLLSGGQITADTPWSFNLHELNCFLLLYTKAGCGKLLINNQVYSLNPSTLLFLDCRFRFRIDIAVSPWNYQILFLDGSLLADYIKLLPENQPILTEIATWSDPAMNLAKIAAEEQSVRIDRRLILSDLLNRIVTYCVSQVLSQEEPSGQIPPYIKNMRELFDNNFQEPHTLDALEERFAISKYRLCREFKNAYGISPLQYLNLRRIEIARHILVTTNLRIHEAGSTVGIDNTNHFINLFKRFTGMTPLEYRQKAK